jgi:hypothetical protein
MAEYAQPRRLNAVTLFLLLIGAAVGYAAWRFFPAYYDSWTVAHVLKESSSKVYQANQLSAELRDKAFHDIADGARRTIQNADVIGIADPDLIVNLELDPESETATLTADYHVVVTHPLVSRTTTLHFHQSESTSLKRVRWE